MRYRHNPSILFVCVANSFRSQMAEGIARSLAAGSWDIWSAGSRPGEGVHPLALKLMSEIGIDISKQRSKGLDEIPKQPWDFVVAMGCGETCPIVEAKTRLDWKLPDPASLSDKEARLVRDELVRRIKTLIKQRSSNKQA